MRNARLVPAVLALALVAAPAFAGAPKRLPDFKRLMDALNSGHKVNLVLDYGKMKLKVDGEEVEAQKAIGGMSFTPWEYFDKGVVRNEKAYVVSSETHLISSARYGYVWNYVRVRIYSDNAVEINAKYITTDLKETVMDETFYSALSNGKDKNGASAFIAP